MQVHWRFFIPARRLIMLYIRAKFREIISNGIKVMERTRMINRWRTGFSKQYTFNRMDKNVSYVTEVWNKLQMRKTIRIWLLVLLT